MPSETGRLLGAYSEKVPLNEEQEQDRVHNPQTPRSPSRSNRVRRAFILLVVISLILWNNIRYSQRSLSIDQRVDRILTETPLIDGHDDFPMVVRMVVKNRIYNDNFTRPFVDGTLKGHVDLPRLAQGKVGGTFWSVFVECPKDGMDFSNENYAASVRETMEQVDVMARIQKAYPDVFSTPPNGTTALQAFRDGKIISPLGIEGLHSIGNSLAHLRIFYELGVSYATLTHNCHNRYADAAVQETPDGAARKADPFWHGISPAGKDVVFEMNRLGMIVDLSHVSADTMRDVLGAGKDDWTGSRAPVIFSHSSAYSVCPHPRNVPDDVLHLVQERNSVVMVNFNPGFVSCKPADRQDGMPEDDPENATLEHVADHIMHIGNLVGFNHVGLGSDFDGILTVPRGLDDVSKFPDLIGELLRRGVSDEDAGKVAGGNLLRVWKEVDEVALDMQTNGALPVED